MLNLANFKHGSIGIIGIIEHCPSYQNYQGCYKYRYLPAINSTLVYFVVKYFSRKMHVFLLCCKIFYR